MTFEVREGDCVSAMRAMPACSVDAVVCDPPYGIGFMGKEWDGAGDGRRWAEMGGPTGVDNTTHTERGGAMHAGKYDLSLSANQSYQRWCEEWARECLRVLKPGGHLLASCGTRTYHRMTSGIEDAGFEIRDTICWMYGSGFPKSLDVGKAIDKRRDWALVERLAGEIARARVETGLSLAEMGEAMQAATDGRYGSLYHRGGFKFFETGTQLPSRPEWDCLRDVLPIADEFREVYEEAEREVITHRTGPRPGDHGGSGHYGHGEDRSLTAPATPEAERWEGWGTALKPAHEPVVVARKPLSGTVAATVLEHGTGALNVDGCRVGTEDNLRRPFGTPSDHVGQLKNLPPGELNPGSPFGRWPPNVVLSHMEECVPVGTRKVKGSAPASGPTLSATESVAHGDYTGERGEVPSYQDETVTAWRCHPDCPVRLLDEQTGELHGAGAARDAIREAGETGMWGFAGDGHRIGDSGGASRFFYCAKSGAAERSAGLNGDRSNHPTVKPISLMRWLVRLVTPPRGTVLDPFTGSGSTGCAAVLEGFDFIGLEREAEYVAIAQARIAWWHKHRGDGEAAEILAAGELRDSVEATGQLGMFDDEPVVVDRANREGEASADRTYTDRGGSNFAMKPGRRR